MDEKTLKQLVSELTRELRPSQVLIGIEAFQRFLRRGDGTPVSRQLVLNLIRCGMPAINVNGTWYGHMQNIDKWFLILTNVKTSNVSDDENQEST